MKSFHLLLCNNQLNTMSGYLNAHVRDQETLNNEQACLK